MAEYIDKDSIVLDYSGLAKISPYDFMSIAEYFANQIKIKPAADVAQVRHGRWEQCFEDWRKQIEGYKCSNCGFKHYGASITHYHYCPNCGCKMDGGDESAVD